MSYTTHKGLNTYIREQTWPRMIVPFILMLLSMLLILLVPTVNQNPTILSHLSDSKKVYQDRPITVSVHIDQLYYAGMNYETDRSVIGRVYYAIEDDICYYFVLDDSYTNHGASTLKDLTLVATLDDNHTMYEQIRASMSLALHFAEDKLDKVSSQVIFNQHEYRNGFYSFSFHGLHILAILNLLVVLYVALVLIHPALSISVRPLRHYGKVETLYAHAVTQFADAKPVGRRNIYITEDFLIVFLPSGIILQPLANITWLYQTHKVQHTKGKAQMVHTLCIVTDCRKVLHIPKLSEPVIAAIIRTIAEHYPNIRVGNEGMKEKPGH